MAQHVRILAWLHGIFSALLLLLGFVVMAIVFGSGAISGDRTAMLITGTVGMALMVLFFLLSIPGFFAAWGLMRYRPWARILAIILGVLHIFSFPFGTALGVYTLWVLLSAETQPLFST